MTKSQINKLGEKLRSLRARLRGCERTIRAILETMKGGSWPTLRFSWHSRQDEGICRGIRWSVALLAERDIRPGG